MRYLLVIGLVGGLAACASQSDQAPPTPVPPAPPPPTYATPYQAPRGSSVSAHKAAHKKMGHDAVAAVQQALGTKGYYMGPIDGVYGNATKAAVKTFQKNEMHVPPTGVVGSREWAALGL
jgi:hypothetical protein